MEVRWMKVMKGKIITERGHSLLEVSCTFDKLSVCLSGWLAFRDHQEGR